MFEMFGRKCIKLLQIAVNPTKYAELSKHIMNITKLL